jgi:hypothetical protein
MITTQQAQDLAKLSHINSKGQGAQIPVGYERVSLPEGIKLDNPDTGFHADIYHKIGTSDYQIVFTATEPLTLNGADLLSDIALGKNQWNDKNIAAVRAAVNSLGDNINITAAGWSLGGMLAQYFAVDYLQTHASSAGISLVTYDSPGGEWGLQQLYSDAYSSVVSNAAAKINAAHFFASSSGVQDTITRAGGAHLGGNTIAVDIQPGADLLERHLTNAFETMTVPESPTTTAVNSFNFRSAQIAAATVAFFLDDGKTIAVEGWLRVAGGALIELVKAPQAERNQIMDALFGTDSSTVGWQFLNDRDYLDRLVLGMAGVTLLAAGVVIQTVGQAGDIVIESSEASIKLMQTARQIAKYAIEAAGNSVTSALQKSYDDISALALKVAADYASHISTATPHNPTIFKLNTDTVNFKPAGSDVLGGTSGGQGLLVNGAGYAGSMPSQYVITGGFVTVAPSDMTTGQVRPGNQSLSNFTQQLNALRQTWYNETQLPANHLPGQTTSSDASFSTPVNAPSGTGNVTLTVTSGNNVVNTLTGQYRYDNNGARIGFDTADGKSYIQFLNVTPKADGGITISNWATIDKETAATSLVQESNLTNPSITPYTDPLTLDAGNDGVRLSATPVNFDLNADGVAEALPWTAPSDPLLVMDVNGDGKINNGTELVDLTDSGKPLNLFRLDSNGDGVLNAQDAAYWNLQLWQDRNQDGYASPEERQSLADTGIVSIDLNPAHLQTATMAGKANVKGVTATYTDGSTRILWDVPFDSAAAATATSSSYAIGINKVSGSGQTALVAMSALGVTLDLNGSGADQAIGGAGNDTLIGTGGDDWLIGGAANDEVFDTRAAWKY